MRFIRPLRATVVLSIVLASFCGRALAEDIEGILVTTGTTRTAGVVANNFFEVTVFAQGLAGASFHDLTTDAWYDLAWDASRGGWFYNDGHYATVGDVYAVHPNPTNLEFHFTGAANETDSVVLGYDGPHPTGFCDVTLPPPDSITPDDPLIEWTFEGDAEYMGMAVVREPSRETVTNFFPSDTSPRQWQPGMLDPASPYAVEIGVWNIVGGAPYVTQTAGGDSFTFVGMMNDSNRVTFTTNPEPATLALMATGLAAGGWWSRRRRRRGA